MPTAVSLDWWAGALLACGVQSLILAFALLRADERPANRWLAATMLVLVGMMSVYGLGWRGHDEPPDWLALWPFSLPLALGPALYGYVRARSGHALPRRQIRLHLIPPTLQLIYLLTLLAWPAAPRHAWKETAHDHLIKPLTEWAVIVSLSAYAVASLIQLRRNRVRLRQERSDADRYDALWLSRILGAFLLTLAALAGIRLYTAFVAELDVGPFQLWLGALSVWLGVEGWRAAALAQPPAPTPPEPREDRDWSLLGRRWRERTEQAGWWREPDLTLTALARRLGTNTAYLSRAINDGLGMNFNEMVNAMRAREVARAIAAGELTGGDLLHGALEAGFSSKATFNRAFRAATGASPSDYRRRLSA